MRKFLSLIQIARNFPLPTSTTNIYSIEGEYVPMPGDEVKYRLCAIPPKNEKFQAVHVKIINFSPEVHRRWEDSY